MNSVFQNKLRSLNSRGFFSVAAIELTSRCNLSCRYCYVASVEKELSTAEVFTALDRLAQAGAVSILLTGGEVFLRKDILEILGHTFANGFFQTVILSNGTLLQKSHIEFLAAHTQYIGYIRFSFFSHHAPVHDAFTGVSGSFGETLAHADELNARGIRVQVVINLTEDNVDTLAETKIFFMSRGFGVQEGHVKVITDERTSACCSGLTSKAFYQRYFDQCSDERLSVMRRDLEERLDCQPSKKLLCEKMFGGIAVRADGEIVPCIAFRDASIGNILTDHRPLQEIFRQSDLLGKLRSLHRTDIEPCSTCKYIDFCALCPGMMMAENGSYEKPNEQSCNYVRALDETLHS